VEGASEPIDARGDQQHIMSAEEAKTELPAAEEPKVRDI
jgi:hypothetical protein